MIPHGIFVPTHEIIAQIGPDTDRILVREWTAAHGDVYYATKEEWHGGEGNLLPAWRVIAGDLVRIFDPPDRVELRPLSQETDQLAIQFTVRILATPGALDDMQELLYDMNVERTMKGILSDYIKRHVRDGWRVEVDVNPEAVEKK